MTTKTKRIGLFIMTGDDATIPLNSKGEPYVLASEPDSKLGGYVKFSEVEITFQMPLRHTIAEELKAKILAERATVVEESTSRIAALDSVINSLAKGTLP